MQCSPDAREETSPAQTKQVSKETYYRAKETYYMRTFESLPADKLHCRCYVILAISGRESLQTRASVFMSE